MADNPYLPDLLIKARQTYRLLSETLDATQQLAQAADRNDHVSVRMVIAMREETIRRLVESRETLYEQFGRSDEAALQRARALWEGAAPAEEEEKPLCDQIAINTRLLRQVQELDRRISSKITGEKSFYLTE